MALHVIQKPANSSFTVIDTPNKITIERDIGSQVSTF